MDLTKLRQTFGWALPRPANSRWCQSPTKQIKNLTHPGQIKPLGGVNSHCRLSMSKLLQYFTLEGNPHLQEFPLDGVEDGVALIANVQQTGFFRVNYEATNSKNWNIKKRWTTTRPTGTWSPTFWLPTTQAYTGSTELRSAWSESL